MNLGWRTLDLTKDRHLLVGERHGQAQVVEEASVDVEELQPRCPLPVANPLVAGTYLNPKEPILHFIAKNFGPLDQITKVIAPLEPRGMRARLIRGPIVLLYLWKIGLLPLIANVDAYDVPARI